MDHSQKYMKRVLVLDRAAEAKGYKAGLRKSAEMAEEQASRLRSRADDTKSSDLRQLFITEAMLFENFAALLHALAEKE